MIGHDTLMSDEEPSAREQLAPSFLQRKPITEALSRGVPQERTAWFLCWPYDLTRTEEFDETQQRSSPMSRAEQYRHLATDVLSRASREPNPLLKTEWENLAETYVRLAEQSEGDWNVSLDYDPIQDMLERTRH